MNFTYRVRLRVGYSDRYFDFNDKVEAVNFAQTILECDSCYDEEHTKQLTISVEIINADEYKQLI